MSYIDLNGHSFHYTVSGKGIPVLFIHGLGSSGLDWEEQTDFLSTSYKTYTLDMRGHGKTKGTKGEYSISIFAHDTVKFIQSMGEPMHIVGISMGGMIAFQLSILHPSFVKSLIIINSSVEISMADPKVRKGIRLRKLIPRLLGMKLMGKLIGKKLFPHQDQILLQQKVAERWAKNKAKDYIKSVNAIAGWTVKNHLDKIECPVLILAAEKDYSPIHVKKAYTKLIKNAILKIIPDAGHALPLEKPKETNEAIINFIENT